MDKKIMRKKERKGGMVKERESGVASGQQT